MTRNQTSYPLLLRMAGERAAARYAIRLQLATDYCQAGQHAPVTLDDGNTQPPWLGIKWEPSRAVGVYQYSLPSKKTKNAPSILRQTLESPRIVGRHKPLLLSERWARHLGLETAPHQLGWRNITNAFQPHPIPISHPLYPSSHPL